MTAISPLRCLFLAMWLAAVGPQVAGANPISLELLSEYSLPAGFRFEGTCVGGLSALQYDAKRERYFALSDGQRGARFYTLRIEVAERAGEGQDRKPYIAEVILDGVVELQTPEGTPYPNDRVDPEGFAMFDERSAYLSSEGVAQVGVAPFVHRIDVASGAWLSALPLPTAFNPKHQDGDQIEGVRQNLGFESLTLSPDRRRLYAASESALAQDAAGIVPGGEHYARVLRFEAGKLSGQYLYPLIMPEGDVLVHGLVELLALDDSGRLLALERTFGHDVGMIVRAFEVQMASHRPESQVDRSRLSPAAKQLPVLEKRSVLDFNQLPILIDNLEGLTFGPLLADGSKTLLLVSDNNNTECRPPTRIADLAPTRFLLFRLVD